MKKLPSGKVREIYEAGDKELVIVTTDRISAFDIILPSAIENKGKFLNLLSLYWFDYTSSIMPNHIISSNLADMPAIFRENPVKYAQRTVLVKKLKMLPFEFIVRGYMFGSMWEQYNTSGSFCGQKIEQNYQLAERLKKPILTPSMKHSVGHDEYISCEELKKAIGSVQADAICKISLALYEKCYEHALGKGIIIADTKFEFGYDEDGRLFLADEIFTPDSSRFWAADEWKQGVSPKSYDKQFVRDWLIKNKLNGVSPAPKLPDDIVEKTAELYHDCYCKITGGQQVDTE